jgi:NTE family protein
MKTTLKAILGLTLVLQLAACVSHYPVNNPIVSTESVQRFSLEDKPDSRADDLLLILTFSGGGTRAASFAYGVLQTIADTQIVVGTQFTFIGEEFVPICSDLSSYPVSRAVTASSAVPGAFTSIILKNYAGTCNYHLPEWATKALDERQVKNL